jgi:hypothetical protein
MLVFIIPIKSAKISRDWSLTSRLFERCLRAICNQTAPNFRVVVVCNERPDTAFAHPNVHYVEVDFPPPMPDPNEEATSGYELSRSKDIARKNADKARKIHVGLDYAQCYNPTHSMVVDADDCVSRHLAEFVAQNPQGAGWYFKQGYIYTEGSRFLSFKRQHFNVVCGSSVVIAYAQRERLFSSPDFYQHAFYEPMEGLAPLPFPGGVYSMANGDNIYMSSETKSHIYGTLFKRLFSRQIFSTVWQVMKYWPTLLTESKRQEFGLYKIEKKTPEAAPTAKQLVAEAAS